MGSVEIPQSIVHFSQINYSGAKEAAGKEFSACIARHYDQELSQFASWEGRAVCFINLCAHSLAAVFKPISYLAIGILCSCFGNMRSSSDGFFGYAVVAGASFVGQSIEATKAAFGLIHPGTYFSSL